MTPSNARHRTLVALIVGLTGLTVALVAVALIESRGPSAAELPLVTMADPIGSGVVLAEHSEPLPTSGASGIASIGASVDPSLRVVSDSRYLDDDAPAARKARPGERPTGDTTPSEPAPRRVPTTEQKLKHGPAAEPAAVRKPSSSNTATGEPLFEAALRYIEARKTTADDASESVAPAEPTHQVVLPPIREEDDGEK